MKKSNRSLNEHWYTPAVKAVQSFIPGNSVYKTMRARAARTGYLFILPFIIGFLLFMLKPMVEPSL